MTFNEKNMKMTSIQLSDYEMSTLKDAKKTLNLVFNRLTAKDNLNRCFGILSGLDDLIEELEANDNSILEFHEEDK